MKKTELKILKYQVTDKFFVEVVKEGETVEFWLCHKDYGTKGFMFGVNAKDCQEKYYEDFIEGNINSYIPIYLENRRKEENE